MARRSQKWKADVIKTGIICLWSILLFDFSVRCETMDAFFMRVFIASDISSSGQAAYMPGALLSRVQAWLFPGASYVSSEISEERLEKKDAYPSPEDLEAFCEENSMYESLAAQADQRLEELNETTSADGDMDSEVQMTADADSVQTISSNPDGIVYSRASLLDYQFLLNNFYVVDSSTSCDRSVLSPEDLLDKDLTMDLSGTDPKILIYHTHSQESFADSIPGDVYGTVLGLGDTLTDILQEKYGVAVYHEKGVFDMIDGQLDRSEAYSLALPVIEQILSEHPSIKVVIDLHRDGVNEDTRLVTTVNGRPTAKIMFFNGLCRGATSGENGYMQNPYLKDNLAFSLQMQLKAAELYPDFTRRIYLRSYRFNMHVMPRTLLVECGAQTNTVEEAHNAMEPLADILYSVLSGH